MNLLEMNPLVKPNLGLLIWTIVSIVVIIVCFKITVKLIYKILNREK